MAKLKVSEAQVLKLVKQEANMMGIMLERVNSGAMLNPKGRYVKFGWGEKSPDLLGGRSIIITQDMVGKTMLQLVAREVKHGNWKYKGTEHEKGQKAVLDKINEMGGDACFVTDVGSFRK